MSGKIIQFPDARGDGMTPEQWREGLMVLHERLSAALAKDRKQIDLIRMVLSIDDVMDICQMIEDTVGPDRFSDDWSA